MRSASAQGRRGDHLVGLGTREPYYGLCCALLAQGSLEGREDTQSGGKLIKQ